MKYRWLFFFVGKAIRERLQRVLLMVFALSLSVGLLVAMMILSRGMRERLADELKAYGANAIITSSEYIKEEMVQKILNINGIDEVLPELYGRACFKEIIVNIIGMPFESIRGLRITGEVRKGYILAGSRLAKAGNLKTGQEVSLSIPCGAPERKFIISGTFEKVGPEDDAIIMELKEAQKLLGLEDRVSVIMLRIKPEGFDLTMERIQKELPELEVRAVRQIATSEESLLKKTELLLIIVSIVVVIASVITVAGIMAATIFERLTDIALMKAMGGTNRQIEVFFTLEAVTAGVLGSIGGLLTGTLAAELIAFSAFQRAVGFPIIAIPVAFLTGLFLSILSAMIPIKRVSAYRPSIILRGEI
ncbi:MAG: ABC transporter permease [Thermodesulfovibrionales bacterium]|nr:ABC transporter permease [Thermodesulfovibrionales bacterium]